jgi:hypothetical protein
MPSSIAIRLQTARWFTTAMLLSPLTAVAIVGSALGDGLVFKLPPDGTAAEFQEETSFRVQPVFSEAKAAQLPKAARHRFLAKTEIKSSGIVAISVVGRERHALLDYRWIELTRTGDDERRSASPAVLKVLVPEERCARGFHPLDHALLTYFNPKQIDKDNRPSPEGFNRLQYELDRFLPSFPPPLKNEVQREQRTIETGAGVFRDCSIIAGTTEFDRYLLGNGRWSFTSEWSIALHDDAPFGVVELQSRSKGREISDDGSYSAIEGTSKLTLARVRSDAKPTPTDSLRGH